jgi:methionyl aminopeptidase
VPSRSKIRLKAPEEIDKMAASAAVLVQVFKELKGMVAPGVTTLELDARAEAMIRDAGGIPSFKGYNGFPATCCISVNDEVVHGIPANRKLLAGEIVGIDCGLILDGWHSDSAETFAVGEISVEAEKLLRVTRECLELGIEQLWPGKRISDIGIAVSGHAHKHGFSVVESLVGHGIGRDLHEEPQVPNYRSFASPDPELVAGMVLAVEPMINAGTKKVTTDDDQWTIRTADNSYSAHFEHTIAVTTDGPRVLTERI